MTPEETRILYDLERKLAQDYRAADRRYRELCEAADIAGTEAVIAVLHVRIVGLLGMCRALGISINQLVELIKDFETKRKEHSK